MKQDLAEPGDPGLSASAAGPASGVSPTASPQAGGLDVPGVAPAVERAQPFHVSFEHLVDSVKDYAIFMLDPQGHVLTWNKGAEHLKGYTFAEIAGQHFSIFYPQEDITAGKPARELAIAGDEGRYEEEGHRLRKDGSPFWANVVITALRDHAGTLVGFAKVTRDLTERRRNEEERLRLARAEEALRLRDEFLSIASHELRTPLTALELGMLQLSETEGLPAGAAGQIQRVRRSSTRLVRLVEMLFDVSRLTTGTLRLELERFDLGATLRDVEDRLADEAAGAGSSLHVRVSGPIEGAWDRLRVEQVITNLLSNAIKYGSPGSIDVEALIEGREARIRVTDRGPGIQEADLARIFDRFERAGSMRNFGGLGLGLYISRQIAEAHAGTISVESKLGEGATFTLCLPLSPPPAEAQERSQRHP